MRPILPRFGARIMLDRILITNDSGIEAPSLAVLERIAGKLAHETKWIRVKSLKFLDSGQENRWITGGRRWKRQRFPASEGLQSA
jgi:hypothetical protein